MTRLVARAASGAMKTKPASRGVKRTRLKKAAKRPAHGIADGGRRGFAPELCGVMTGPRDLSVREGFGRG